MSLSGLLGFSYLDGEAPHANREAPHEVLGYPEGEAPARSAAARFASHEQD